MMTNFHLPRSTLFMLVVGLRGLETHAARPMRMRSQSGYRFYSYGDACLLYPAEALMTTPFAFTPHQAPTAPRARGEIATPHGDVRTPAFMPVGTPATVKAHVPGRRCAATGADIVLGNTYHLMLRPGAERVAALGGLHKFMNWPHADPDRLRRLPGDVAVASLRKIDEQRRRPSARISTARRYELTPERAIEIQAPARLRHLDAARRMRAAAGRARGDRARDAAVAALGASARKRAFEARAARGYALFGIVQGGDDPALRVESARALADIGFRRLRHRRAGGRRAAGGDAGDDRGDDAGAAGRAAALSDGRRHAGRHRSRRSRAASTCSTA